MTAGLHGVQIVVASEDDADESGMGSSGESPVFCCLDCFSWLGCSSCLFDSWAPVWWKRLSSRLAGFTRSGATERSTGVTVSLPLESMGAVTLAGRSLRFLFVVRPFRTTKAPKLSGDPSDENACLLCGGGRLWW